MTILLRDNVVSSLGFTTEENYQNVKQGVCGLKFFSQRYGLPEPFIASEIDDARLDAAFNEAFNYYAGFIENSDLEDELRRELIEERNVTKYTKLEKAAIVSIAEALKDTSIDPTDSRVLFILSTTKGNVFLLDKDEKDGYSPEQLYLWRSANLIAGFLGSINSSVVVSNACISGVSALLEAQRALKSRRCNFAIVTGVDVLSKFIIAGFQSLKALSSEVCKPFDANRTGLNIGEAAATIILTERPSVLCNSGEIELTAGAVYNDANHISGPSRTGEGSYLSLHHVLKHIDPKEIAYVCAHGTATPYNDEMESIALTRAGLKDAPVYSLKGFFGHTLGAAGVLESVISTRALKDGTILKTYGCETPGVTSPLDVVMENRATTKRRCVKMLSGFGGCNASILFTKL